MPTLFRTQGFNVVIFTLDHRPAHVHAIGPDGAAIFELNCPHGPLVLREVQGKVALALVRRIARDIEPKVGYLCAEWRRIHGHH